MKKTLVNETHYNNELSSWIESYPEYVEILEAEIQRYSDLYEALL